LFTKDELKLFNGVDRDSIYLSILGEVYDVTTGKFYSKDGDYGFFAGKDFSRGFATGEPAKDSSEEELVLDLTPKLVADIGGWRKFYRKHKDYFFVGRLIGVYYDSQGQPTEILDQVEAMLEEESDRRAAIKQLNKEIPLCNSRWNKGEGTSLWCQNEMISDGRHLVPRKYFVELSQNERCACVELQRAIHDPETFKKYDNCPEEETMCVRF